MKNISVTTQHCNILAKTMATLAAASFSLVLATSASAVPALFVSGNKIMANGQPFSVAGNSLFWSNTGWGGEKYYTAGTVGWLKSDWKSNLVRAAMGVDESGGYIADPVNNKNRVKTVIDAAIANDMYVIVDWHSHHAEQYQSQSIAFFQDMARTYGNTTNVIYEIYNEPLQISWSGVIKPYAQAVVNAIRAIDPDNLIVVGTPTWSQDVDIASSDKIAGTNIAYTLHFYAGTHGQSLRNKAQTALNNGAALFVTEWGSVNADGNGSVANSETDAWVGFMKANNISNANWALNDKAEGASALTSGASGNGGWTNNQITASGAKAKDIIYNWSPANTVIATLQAENYRIMSGVQTEATTDTGGGQNVGYTDAGDWMSYDNTSVNIPQTGNYVVEFRVASAIGGGSLSFEEAGGSIKYANLNIPTTGGWQSWTTLQTTAYLTAGTHKFGIATNVGGWNINWFRIIKSDNASNTTLVARMRGTSGQESVRLKVGGTTVQTWTLSTTMSNYTIATSLSGDSQLEFTNDATGRDVQIDYLSVNGAIRQSEDQTYNTGVWQSGTCGGGSGHSEWLNCNGAIGYGNF